MKASVETWLKGQFGDDDELVGEIYREYRQTLERLFGELSDAMGSGDATARDRVLHAIKGAAVTVGDAELAALARESRACAAPSPLQDVMVKMRKLMEEL